MTSQFILKNNSQLLNFWIGKNDLLDQFVHVFIP